MARDPRHDVLFEPMPIGPKTMRNRFYQSPHCTSFGVQRPAAQALHRAVKAEGGWGVVNTEYCSVDPSCDSSPLVSARLWDEDDVAPAGGDDRSGPRPTAPWPGSSSGTAAASPATWRRGSPAGSVSQMTDESLYSTSCYELDRDGIRAIQAQYVAAARRALAAGFDIVNIHGAECGAITQHFLMAKFNRRRTSTAASFENRARFWLETIEQVQSRGRRRDARSPPGSASTP